MGIPGFPYSGEFRHPVMSFRGQKTLSMCSFVIGKQKSSSSEERV